MSRQGRAPGLRLGILLVALLLAGCNAGSTASTQPSPTSATSGIPQTTATSGISGTPTVIVHGDWQTYIDGNYGFHLDVPAILTLSFPPSTSANHYILWQYDFGKGQPPQDQALFAEVSVMVFASTKGPYPCTQGSPLTIGSGVTAYEDDSLDAPTPTPGGGDTGMGGLDVNLATGGVYLHISLDGHPPKDTFRARYETIWQHILNSFVPGPPVPDGHPCG